MKKLYLYLTVGLLVLFVQSCKKTEIPVPEGEAPLFRAEFQTNQSPKYFEAGRDHFFQFADFYLDTNDVYVFRSLLAKDEFCIDNCQESLQIEIRSNSQSNGQLPNLAQALQINNYHFAQATDTSHTEYRYHFNGSVVGTNQLFQKTLQWEFSPEIDPSGLDLTGEEITVKLAENIPFRVKLDVVDAYGAKGSKEIRMLPNTHSGLSLKMIGNATHPILQAQSDPLGNEIGALSWTPIGSGSLFPIVPSHPYANYCVSGKDANNHEVITCGEYVNLFGQNIFCTAQITWTKEKETIMDNLWLSSVRIVYTDSQGQIWTTFNANQTNSLFAIEKIENYKDTKDGIKTKKITAKFSVNITNGSSTKTIDGQTVFAVGAPQ